MHAALARAAPCLESLTAVVAVPSRALYSCSRLQVREFCELAFHYAGLEHRKQPIKLVWEGVDADELGKDAETHQVLIRVDKRYFRPTEVPHLPCVPLRCLTWPSLA